MLSEIRKSYKLLKLAGDVVQEIGKGEQSPRSARQGNSEKPSRSRNRFLGLFFISTILTGIMVSVLGMGLFASFVSGNDTGGIRTRGGMPTEIANRELGAYVSVCQAAQEKYGVDWTIIGALAKLQTDCGKYPSGSVGAAGEVGFIRFFPTDWSGSGSPGVRNDSGWRPQPDPPCLPDYSVSQTERNSKMTIYGNNQSNSMVQGQDQNDNTAVIQGRGSERAGDQLSAEGNESKPNDVNVDEATRSDAVRPDPYAEVKGEASPETDSGLTGNAINNISDPARIRPYDVDMKIIAQNNGCGVDGDMDGFADPYNPNDAIYATAHKLSQLLKKNDNMEAALTAFLNGDRDMAMRVIGKARLYTVYTLPGQGLIWPISPDVAGYANITSGFGMRTNPITGIYKLHSGIDIGVAGGTPILASHSGLVISSGYLGAYGNCVIIESTDGSLQTLYGHMMSHPLVEYGQPVMIGTVIGYVGSTGNSTGNHLHFETRLRDNGGDSVDPLSLVDSGDVMVAAAMAPYTQGMELAAMFDIRQPCGLDATTLESFMLRSAPPNSIFWNYQGQLGPFLLDVERRYGVNAAFLSCLAIHESDWGSSAIALKTNNVFGWEAYNSNPDAARRFPDMLCGVEYVASHLSSSYLDPGGSYFMGTTILAVNYNYCALNSGGPDWGWSEDIGVLLKELYDSPQNPSACSPETYSAYSGYYDPTVQGNQNY